MSKVQSAEQLRTCMQQIDPYKFEDFVAVLWEKEGWITTVSQASNDQGVDIIGEKTGTIERDAAGGQSAYPKRTGPNGNHIAAAGGERDV